MGGAGIPRSLSAIADEVVRELILLLSSRGFELEETTLGLKTPEETALEPEEDWRVDGLRPPT